ncbi:MAG TPA: diaminopropionate ammonia-lyase [Actinomycetes bacterium]
MSTRHAAQPWLPNPARDRTWTCSPVPRDVMDFHRGLAGYAPTRLVDLPVLAAELGVGRVLVKDESLRLGLPAFKSLGASWAIHRALRARLRRDAEGPSGSPVTLVAATDGNHGRAVARFSRLLGHRARIFVPDGVHPVAVQAIRDEGADVTHVPADYDEAVRAAARCAADDGGVLIQDTAWNEYEEVPGWIVDGYSTLFRELDDQLADLGIEQPDMVLVPTGVGSLLQAGLTHYRARPTGADTAVVSVEPVEAACVQASIAAGHPVSVVTGHTIMAGLNCGTVSSLAWPSIHRGLDATATVTDDQAIVAARALAENGVPVGPCGAAPLAAAQTLATRLLPDTRDLGHQVSSRTTLVLIATEGESANPVPVGRPSRSARTRP